MLINRLNTIYDLTLSMSKSLTDGDFVDLERLLITRQELMDKVDEYKSNIPDYQYSSEERKVLKEIIKIDESLAPELNKYMDEARSNLNQIKATKEVSRKYQPYSKQINGAFIDKIIK
jgi:hypothetical protein